MADFDVDAFLDSYRSRVEEVRICIPEDLLAQHGRLDRQLRAAAMGDDENKAKELAARVLALEEEMEQSGQVFTFRGVSHERWADLLREHPPTEEQLAINRAYDHNPETFPVAVIAASSVSPKLSEEQARRAKATLTSGDFERLWRAAYAANVGVSAAPKSGLATDLLHTNGVSSTTSAREASRVGSGSVANGSRSRRTSTTRKAD